MIEFIIRDMTISDISLVTKYELAIIGETLGEAVIEDHIKSSELMKYFVMETKNSKEIIGFISLWIDIDKAQINNFFIIDRYRRKGLGRKFLTHTLDYFKSRKINEVTLEVRQSNISAIKLYEQFNFNQVSVRNNYYSNGENALFLYLRIGSD